MQYHEAANLLFDLRRYGAKPGTESTAELLATLDDPHEGLACVQVAGSNGKGSTARMVESVLREAGLTVGLYTSPHFEDVRERIRVDGRKVSRSALCRFADAIHPHVVDRAADGESPTFFEAMTAMALWQFAREDVDVAVLEVGIGGRLDATSVVDPVASAVTNVSLEHTQLLGDTVAEIARDKAHVAPADAPLVTGATGDALAAVREQAGDVVTVGEGGDVRTRYEGRTNHVEAAVSVAGGNGDPGDDGWRVETHLPTLGAHQATNAGIACALARQVVDGVADATLTRETLERGLRNAHWPGRFEILGDEPLTVLDGAHNPDACERVAETLGEFDFDELHVVFGAMHDKAHREMAAGLPSPDAVYACEPDLDRAEDDDVLARVFADAGVERSVASGAVDTALDRALESAGPADCVLVTGSLFSVAEARTRWTRLQIPTTVRDTEDAAATLALASVEADQVTELGGDGVHRVLRTRLQARQATRVRESLLARGGACAVSGLETEGERLDVVLMGTLTELDGLASALDGGPQGLAQFARELRGTLDLDGGDGGERGVADGDVTDPTDGAGRDPTDGGPYPWSDGTAVMGILNVTPDSFHDGGEYDAVEDAVARAREMVEAGVDVLDVGGESTRPGADPVTPAEERGRVVPVVAGIRDAGIDVPISVDTRRAAVGRAALAAGADILNDVSGLSDPETRFVAAEHDAPLVVMHSVDTPVDPETDVDYDDVVTDVLDELRETVLLAEKAGLDREQIVVDPGLGFGKTAAESFELLDRLDEFDALGCPVLVGHSHKSMFGVIGREDGDRLPATVAGTALAADRGADVIRVHDVAENVDAVRVTEGARDPETLDD